MCCLHYVSPSVTALEPLSCVLRVPHAPYVGFVRGCESVGMFCTPPYPQLDRDPWDYLLAPPRVLGYYGNPYSTALLDGNDARYQSAS